MLRENSQFAPSTNKRFREKQKAATKIAAFSLLSGSCESVAAFSAAVPRDHLDHRPARRGHDLYHHPRRVDHPARDRRRDPDDLHADDPQLPAQPSVRPG
jgi:hypothetical protein